MSRRARAAWRLLKSTVHAVHGLAIVLIRFRSLDAGRRQAKIGWWSKKVLRLMGIELRVDGAVAEGGVLLAANHVSWLDITALHAVAPQARFVAKAGIRSWLIIGQLADAANTLYIERERKRDALRVVQLVGEALRDGQTIAVFPEGTTSDGRTLLPFHANLLQAAIESSSAVGPVAIRYSDPVHAVSPAVEYVGSTTLVESMWRVACAEGVVAHVSLLPTRHGGGGDRRALARNVQADVATELRRRTLPGGA